MMTLPVPSLRLRLDISYDGSSFSGWAVQPARRTVAGVMSQALSLLFRTDVALVVAGRTDAGVHARGQVAHIDVGPSSLLALTPRHLEPTPEAALTGLLRRLGGLLPRDVRVRAVAVAPAGFDARFSALRRHYEYRIGTADWGVEPLSRVGILARPGPLNGDAMAQAGQRLLGLRDFATFCKARPDATTIRELQQLTVSAVGDVVTIAVAADAFCYSMVRSLVGVLIAVGDGRMPIDEPELLLSAQQRTSRVHTAPARGLTLVAVDYPADTALAARSVATRAVRTSTDVAVQSMQLAVRQGRPERSAPTTEED